MDKDDKDFQKLMDLIEKKTVTTDKAPVMLPPFQEPRFTPCPSLGSDKPYFEPVMHGRLREIVKLLDTIKITEECNKAYWIDSVKSLRKSTGLVPFRKETVIKKFLDCLSQPFNQTDGPHEAFPPEIVSIAKTGFADNSGKNKIVDTARLEADFNQITDILTKCEKVDKATGNPFDIQSDEDVQAYVINIRIIWNRYVRKLGMRRKVVKDYLKGVNEKFSDRVASIMMHCVDPVNYPLLFVTPEDGKCEAYCNKTGNSLKRFAPRRDRTLDTSVAMGPCESPYYITDTSGERK